MESKIARVGEWERARVREWNSRKAREWDRAKECTRVREIESGSDRERESAKEVDGVKRVGERWRASVGYSVIERESHYISYATMYTICVFIAVVLLLEIRLLVTCV